MKISKDSTLGILAIIYMGIASIITAISFISVITYYTYGPGGNGPFIAVTISTGLNLFFSVLRGALWPIMSWPVWYGETPFHHWLFFPWYG